MDCGPAALKSLLEGHGIPVSYGRLREACQTGVDGTSIDTVTDIANWLGLPAEQIMLPPDHVLLPSARALPAIVLVRLPNGASHFTLVWRRLAGLVQVMDPASGRKWVSTSRLLRDLYRHEMPVPAAAWREWASSTEALSALGDRARTWALRAVVSELAASARRARLARAGHAGRGDPRGVFLVAARVCGAAAAQRTLEACSRKCPVSRTAPRHPRDLVVGAGSGCRGRGGGAAC
jgi:hypothetical protein